MVSLMASKDFQFGGVTHTVTADPMVKAGLFGIGVDGRHLGNIRQRADGFRFGMGSEPVRHPDIGPVILFPLSLTVLGVAEIIGQRFLEAQAAAQAGRAAAKAAKPKSEPKPKTVRPKRTNPAQTAESAG